MRATFIFSEIKIKKNGSGIERWENFYCIQGAWGPLPVVTLCPPDCSVQCQGLAMWSCRAQGCKNFKVTCKNKCLNLDTFLHLMDSQPIYSASLKSFSYTFQKKKKKNEWCEYPIMLVLQRTSSHKIAFLRWPLNVQNTHSCNAHK